MEEYATTFKGCTHPPLSICHCGIRVGQIVKRHGVLCRVDERGRRYLSAPRAGDVALAQRILLAVEELRDGPLQIEGETVTNVSEHGGASGEVEDS